MLAIFQFDFMLRAFGAGILIAIIAPLVGMFLVVRRYSLMADTLAHVSLAGVAAGLLAGINPVLTAIMASVLAAFGIERLRSSKKIFGESVLALFLSGSLAIAVVLISLSNSFNVNLFSFLFGSISTIQPSDLYMIVALGIPVVGIILIFYKELFLVSIDEELAQASGINARFFNLLFIILAAITVSLSLRIVGVLLIGALMVIPVITAMQFGRSFKQTILLALLFSLVAVMTGLFLSFYIGLASGGTIVLNSLVLFLLSLVVNKTKNP